MNTTATETPPEETATTEPPSQDTHIFDPARYDDPELRLPKVDDEGIDQIEIGFSGTVKLDRGNPEHVALFRRLKGGHDITLSIEATCGKKVNTWRTDDEGYVRELVAGAALKVTSVNVSEAEGGD